MRQLVRFAILAGAALTCAAQLAACNTVAGVGRDVSAAGSAVTRASHDVRR